MQADPRSVSNSTPSKASALLSANVRWVRCGSRCRRQKGHADPNLGTLMDPNDTRECGIHNE